MELGTEERILWALNSFKVYKSAGPDGVIMNNASNGRFTRNTDFKNNIGAWLKINFIRNKWQAVLFKKKHCLHLSAESSKCLVMVIKGIDNTVSITEIK